MHDANSSTTLPSFCRTLRKMFKDARKLLIEQAASWAPSIAESLCRLVNAAWEILDCNSNIKATNKS